MTDEPLFSAGFVWSDDDGVATSATPVATPGTTPAPSAQRQVDGDSHGRVASVASVADCGDGWDRVSVSQSDVAECATPDATPETAEIRHPNRPATPPVADVASVAFWREAVEWMRTNPQPPEIYATSWSVLYHDALNFVLTWGEDAIRAGWTTIDVFGAHPDPAARRLDTQGLVTLLQGRPVQSIDQATALVGSGREMLTHYRHPKPAVTVPVWMVRRVDSTGARPWRRVPGGSALTRLPPDPPGSQAALGVRRMEGQRN